MNQNVKRKEWLKNSNHKLDAILCLCIYGSRFVTFFLAEHKNKELRKKGTNENDPFTGMLA